MTFRVHVRPELLRWARERAGADVDALVRKFPKYREWESGEARPTFKQLQNFAKAVHAGVGYFFCRSRPTSRSRSLISAPSAARRSASRA